MQIFIEFKIYQLSIKEKGKDYIIK